MKTAIFAAIAILIAGSGTQTLPFYSGDGLVAQCMAEVPKKVEEYVKNHTEFLKSGYLSDPEKSATQLFESRCYDLLKVDMQIRDELATRWNAIDPRIRRACTINTQVVSYSSLQECIEHFEKGGSVYKR
jgi:hypothetical protein